MKLLLSFTVLYLFPFSVNAIQIEVADSSSHDFSLEVVWGPQPTDSGVNLLEPYDGNGAFRYKEYILPDAFYASRTTSGGQTVFLYSTLLNKNFDPDCASTSLSLMHFALFWEGDTARSREYRTTSVSYPGAFPLVYELEREPLEHTVYGARFLFNDQERSARVPDSASSLSLAFFALGIVLAFRRCQRYSVIKIS